MVFVAKMLITWHCKSMIKYVVNSILKLVFVFHFQLAMAGVAPNSQRTDIPVSQAVHDIDRCESSAHLSVSEKNCGDAVDYQYDDYRPKHLKYFGFTLIDTFWDDPTDVVPKINYADEVHAFSNLADILIVNSTDNILERLTVFHELEIKAVLHLNELFFQVIGSNSESGTQYALRPDYVQRWNQFTHTNESMLSKEYIGAFYVCEEPTWNGIDFTSLNSVSELIDEQYPKIPIMIIEAYPVLDLLKIPKSADWIGFDHYFVKDPNIDTSYQQEWAVLKSKLSSPDQNMMVIMDSHYIQWAHESFGNITLDEMDVVANNYYKLAKSDSRVIGMLGYFWPNGFDFSQSIGARGMPERIKKNYIRIGREITGKVIVKE